MHACSRAVEPSGATSTAYACSRSPFESTAAAAGSSSTTRILIRLGHGRIRSVLLEVVPLSAGQPQEAGVQSTPGLRSLSNLTDIAGGLPSSYAEGDECAKHCSLSADSWLHSARESGKRARL